MASARFIFPPLDCSLLFPDLINFHMEINARFPVFVYPGECAPESLVEISFLEFGRAAHRVAHTLRPSRQGPDGLAIMIIAHTDTILYHAISTGLEIAGWIPFPVSPRNSAEVIVSMMKKTHCSHIVTLYNVHKALIDSIRCEQGEEHLTIYELPALQYVFPRLGKEIASDLFVPYPPPLNRPDLNSPAIYLHSSGSTGFPKPIAHSHKVQVQWLMQHRLYSEIPAPRRVGSMAPPPFHAFGISTQLYVPMACLVSAVVYPPRTWEDPFALPVIPTSDNMIDCVRKTGSNVLLTVPTFLEQMAQSKEAIEILKKVDSVHFGGGPLPPHVGDSLCAAGVQLSPVYGATEFGVPIAMPRKQDAAEGDWAWMRFSDEMKIRWDPQGNDTYELQILSTEYFQTAVENLPDVKGYSTSDLFVKHPSKDMWKIIGRVDDVITLASGEKIVPAPMESVIESSQFLQGVVMFGRERNQVGLLIEPRPEYAIDVTDKKAVAKFKNQIWPVIEEANKSSPAFSRIFKEMILMTSDDKPMLRSAKGTVQRKATLSAYEKEIDSLYHLIEATSVDPDGLAGPSAWTSEALERWFLEHTHVISFDDRKIDPHADLFAQGFDSLSATYLRNRLLAALRNSSDPEIRKIATCIPLNVIFQSPTIRVLSSRIAALVKGEDAARHETSCVGVCGEGC